MIGFNNSDRLSRNLTGIKRRVGFFSCKSVQGLGGRLGQNLLCFERCYFWPFLRCLWQRLARQGGLQYHGGIFLLVDN